MDKLTVNDFKKMIQNALKNITERSDEFSKLDAVLGDGDHGTAIVCRPLYNRLIKVRNSRKCLEIWVST